MVDLKTLTSNLIKNSPIKEYSTSIIYRQNTIGIYDINSDTNNITTTDISLKAIIEETKYTDKMNIPDKKTITCLIASKDLPFTPQKKDIIVVGTDEWEIYEIKISTGNILYELVLMLP